MTQKEAKERLTFIQKLSVLVFLVTSAVLIFALYECIKYDKKLDAASIIIGTFINAFMLVLNYWLGSSSGSREKDKMITPVVNPTTINNNTPDPNTTVNNNQA